MNGTSNLIWESLAAYGLAIVISFSVAVLIKGIVVALPRLRRHQETEPHDATPASVEGQLPQGHLAAITAAVATMTRSFQIVHIENQATGNAWTAGGRMSHQASHSPKQGSRS